MSKKKKYSTSFMIGVFVLSGLAILVGFLLWMGATQFFKEYNYFAVYFDDSVVGLENGSSVKYLGVPCGMVQSIAVAPDGNLVEIIIKIDKNVQISEDIIVRLEMAGFAGGKFLQLFSSKTIHTNNFHFSFEPPYPVLNTAPTQFDEIVLSAGSIITDLKEVKWGEISDGLAGTLEGTNKLINSKDLLLIIADLRETTQSLNTLINNLSDGSFSNNLHTTMSSLSNSAVQLEHFSTNLNKKLEDVNVNEYLDKYYLGFETTIKTTNTAIEAVTNKFQSSMLGINILLEDANRTNNILQKTLQNINESPYMLLTEPPPKEEIKITTKK